MTTGQCICKPRYGGRRCDECDVSIAPRIVVVERFKHGRCCVFVFLRCPQVGYGNLDLDCPACACNVNGSVSTVCNVVSGQCECNVGTEGIHCDRCREEFFGLSDEQPGACEGRWHYIDFCSLASRNKLARQIDGEFDEADVAFVP